MSVQPRKLVRAALHLLAVATLVVLTGVAIQAAAEAEERGRFPAPGRVVEIGGGQTVHLRTWGDGNHGPTIVAEASAGMFSSEWSWIGQALAADYRVVAADRPGLGWSAGGQHPRDALSAATGLTRALQIEGIDPPYVVIGHSFGGMTARVFADMHRSDVVGIALLDTTHPDGGGGQFYAAEYRRLAWIGHSGLNQLLPARSGWESLPAPEVDAAVAVSGWTSHLDATADEMAAWDATMQQVRDTGTFGEIPLLVVRGPGSPRDLELQRSLLGLSSESEFAQLENVSHVGMLINQPESDVLLNVLRPWLDSLRSG
ncbi:MAG TPA: alpha/beta hydrolase [Candidatus Limnocylindrales bacterium]|nr:alpha/beta hydrolase [Candidatus Limnocylindrales bacterium]